MRTLLPAVSLLVVVALGCKDGAPTGPGTATITETTTSTTTTTTSTSTSTTTTIPNPTVAAFTFSPRTPEVLQLVFFDASGSTPGTGRTIVRYDWDFGDGVTKTGIRATHDYTPSGVYLVTLTVTDDTGTKTRSSETITVRPVVPVP